MAYSNVSSLVGLTSIFESEFKPINKLKESIKKFKPPTSPICLGHRPAEKTIQKPPLNDNPPCLDVHKHKYKDFNEKVNKINIVDESDQILEVKA